MGIDSIQRTLAIIKPDACANNLCGKIIGRVEQEGLSIIGMKLLHISSEQAAQFYKIHRGKPFFDDLINFMSSGKIIVLALEADDCINRWRKLMGATDPEKADEGTIRKQYGTAVNRNACHGSDAVETAETELKFFFSSYELVS